MMRIDNITTKNLKYNENLKSLVAVLLLSGGVTSTFAQSDCNANSSISHEAVRAKNYKDAYAPCMAVLKDCPTLRYYTYTDAPKNPCRLDEPD